MAISLRFLFWFPVAIFFILNMIFKLIIFILQNVGNATVWCNRNVVKLGDWATDKAKNDDSLDDFIDDLQKRNKQTRKMVKAKRKKQ
jgi:hypothetical protein